MSFEAPLRVQLTKFVTTVKFDRDQDEGYVALPATAAPVTTSRTLGGVRPQKFNGRASPLHQLSDGGSLGRADRLSRASSPNILGASGAIHRANLESPLALPIPKDFKDLSIY